ncbi:hypothetical protein BX600DRAFT_243531 [Xylariales sp. PMI_506]|nr:hypothetical protein BX600DRAFT_243531 [Xylariales sp. PMI_506]
MQCRQHPHSYNLLKHSNPGCTTPCNVSRISITADSVISYGALRKHYQSSCTAADQPLSRTAVPLHRRAKLHYICDLTVRLHLAGVHGRTPLPVKEAKQCQYAARIFDMCWKAMVSWKLQPKVGHSNPPLHDHRSGPWLVMYSEATHVLES